VTRITFATDFYSVLWKGVLAAAKPDGSRRSAITGRHKRHQPTNEMGAGIAANPH
jgi:hypothetical protein